MNNEKLAFGVEPARKLFRLRLARYQALGETVAEFVRHSGAATAHPGPVRLLDVGLGKGRSMRYIEAESVKGQVEFFGLDISTKRLDNVYNPGNWKLIESDASRGLPFESESFDIVLSEQLLEHLYHPDVVISEMGRVLKPGGLFILGVPIFPPGVSLIRKYIVPVYDKWRSIERGHVQAFTLSSISAAVKGCGLFDIVERRGFRIISGGLLSPLEDKKWWWRFNRRLGRALPYLCTEAQIVGRRRR